MERIGVRELRQHASRYLDRVRTGESFEVTDRGALVAVLSPPAPDFTARARLVSEGRLMPGSGPLQLPLRRMPPRPTRDVLDELREDR